MICQWYMHVNFNTLVTSHEQKSQNLSKKINSIFLQKMTKIKAKSEYRVNLTFLCRDMFARDSLHVNFPDPRMPLRMPPFWLISRSSNGGILRYFDLYWFSSINILSPKKILVSKGRRVDILSDILVYWFWWVKINSRISQKSLVFHINSRSHCSGDRTTTTELYSLFYLVLL